MPFVETDFWVMEIPEEWVATQEDDLVCIVDPDDIGSLDVSALCKEQGEVTIDDLNVFAEELYAAGRTSKMVESGDFEGLYFEYASEELHWREWFLKHSSKSGLLVFASYTCDPEQAGMDDVVVDQMLESLVPLDQEKAAEN